jgi:hypothetical protein
LLRTSFEQEVNAGSDRYCCRCWVFLFLPYADFSTSQVVATCGYKPYKAILLLDLEAYCEVQKVKLLVVPLILRKFSDHRKGSQNVRICCRFAIYSAEGCGTEFYAPDLDNNIQSFECVEFMFLVQSSNKTFCGLTPAGLERKGL